MNIAAKYPSPTLTTESTEALTLEPKDGLAATPFVGAAA